MHLTIRDWCRMINLLFLYKVVLLLPIVIGSIEPTGSATLTNGTTELPSSTTMSVTVAVNNDATLWSQNLTDQNPSSSAGSSLGENFDCNTSTFASCLYGGVCVRHQNNDSTCACPTGISGSRCEKLTYSTFKSPNITLRLYEPSTLSLQRDGRTVVTGNQYNVGSLMWSLPYAKFRDNPTVLTYGEHCTAIADCCSSQSLTNAGYTFSMYFRIRWQNNDLKRCVFSSNPKFGYGLEILTDSDYKMEVQVFNCDKRYGPFTVPTTNQKYFHLAVAASSSRGVRLYLNGRLMNNATQQHQYQQNNDPSGYDLSLRGNCKATPNHTAYIDVLSMNIWQTDFQDDGFYKNLSAALSTLPPFRAALNKMENTSYLTIYSVQPLRPGIEENALPLANGWLGTDPTHSNKIQCFENLDSCDLGLTLSFWLRTNNNANGTALVSSSWLSIGILSSKVRLYITKGGIRWPHRDLKDVLVNDWYHFVITYDHAVQKVSWYVNGAIHETIDAPTQNSTSAAGQNNNSPISGSAGGSNNGTSSVAQGAGGSIDGTNTASGSTDNSSSANPPGGTGGSSASGTANTSNNDGAASENGNTTVQTTTPPGAQTTPVSDPIASSLGASSGLAPAHGLNFGRPDGLFIRHSYAEVDDILIYEHHKVKEFVEFMYNSYDTGTCLHPRKTCLNTGKCVGGVCQCANGFTGARCETMTYVEPAMNIQPDTLNYNNTKVVGKWQGVTSWTADLSENAVLNTTFHEPYMNLSSSFPIYLGQTCQDCCLEFPFFEYLTGFTLHTYFKILKPGDESPQCILHTTATIKFGFTISFKGKETLEVAWIRAENGNGGCNWRTGSVNMTISTTKWHHLLLAVNTSDITVMLNGKVVHNSKMDASETFIQYNTSHAVTLLGGCSNADQPADVAIKDLGYWMGPIDAGNHFTIFTETATEPDIHLSLDKGETLSLPEATLEALRYTDGIVKDALRLPGSMQLTFSHVVNYTRCGDDLALCNSGYTLMLWVRLLGTDGRQSLFCNRGITLGLKDKKLELHLQRGKTVWLPLTSTHLVTPNNWYHVAIVYDTKASAIELYVNGLINGRTAVRNNEGKEDNLKLGYTMGVPHGIFTEPAKADFDEVLVWELKKSAAFVLKIYGQYETPPTVPPPTTTASTTTTTSPDLVGCVQGDLEPSEHKSINNPKRFSAASSPQFSAKLKSKCHHLRLAALKWELGNSTWKLYASLNFTFDRKMKYRPRYVMRSNDSPQLVPGIVYKVILRIHEAGDRSNVLLTDTLFFSVVASPLRTKIRGGKKRTFQRGTVVTLDARAKSYDPDLDDRGDKSGMKFVWVCAGAACNELLVPGSKPDQGIIQVNTKVLATGSYDFMSTVSKDTRSATFTQTLKIVDGTVPNVTVTCLINCDAYVAGNRKMSLMALCNSCSKQILRTLTYKWTLYNEQGGSRQEINNLPDLSATGSTGPGLVIKSDSLTPGVSYCIRLKVTCQICEDSEAEYCFTTNQPPEGGNCSVSPLNGTALMTEFTISCSDWLDEGSTDALLTYKYDVQYSANGRREPVYSGSDQNSPGLRLKEGKKKSNYLVTVVARIYDAYGSFNETSMTIEVLPATGIPSGDGETTDTSAVMDSMSSLTQGSDSVLGAMLLQGDTSQAAQLISTVAGVLNSISYDTTADTNSSDTTGNASTSQDTMKELRKSLITQVSSMSSQVKNPDGVRAVTQALQSTTDVTSDVSDESLTEVTSALGNLVGTSSLLIAERPEEALSLGEPLLGVVGNMLEGVKPQTSIDTTRAEESAKLLEDTPTENEENLEVSPEELAYLQSLSNKKTQKQRDVENQKAATLTPNLLSSEKTITASLTNTLAPGEDALEISTSILKMSLQRSQSSTLKNQTTTSGNVSLSFGNALDSATSNVVDVSVSSYEVNPYPWMTGADDVTSDVFSLAVADQDGKDVTIQDDVTIQFTNAALPAPIIVDPANQTGNGSGDSGNSTSADRPYHKVVIDSAEAAFVTRLTFDGEYEQVELLIKKDSPPAGNEYDVREVVTGAFDGDNKTEFDIAVTAAKLKGAGVYYVRLDLQQSNIGSSRRRRSVDNSTTTAASLPPYALTLTTTACRSLDTATNTWTTEGCQMGPGSTVAVTDCRCRPSADRKSFGASFIAPPNLIDFRTVWAKFANLSDNAAVFSTVIVLLLLYVLLAVWARFQDKRDETVGEVLDLEDNVLGDNNMYVVSVETGYKPGAGTSALVWFVLAGEDGDSGTRHLAGTTHTTRFPSGKVRRFYMTTSEHLGTLTTLRLWHDGLAGGRRNAWYVNKVTVEDIREKQTYTFMCYNWLAVDRGDMCNDRTLKAAGVQETTRFSYLLSENSKQKLAEHHMWASVFYRPVRTHFTRVQRLSCCLSFLFLSMITSCMFYKTEENVERPMVLQLGPFRFSPQEAFVSAITIAIVFPVNLIVLHLFRKTADPTLPSWCSGRCQKRQFPVSTGSGGRGGSATSSGGVSGCGVTGRGGSDAGDCTPITVLTEDSMHSSLVSSEAVMDVKNLWPGWLRVVAWLLLLLAILPSAFFVILYSMEWGSEKSNQWLTACTLTFLEQFLLIDPIKVFIIALIVTWILRKTSTDEEKDEDVTSCALSEKQLAELRLKEEETRTSSRILMRDVVATVILAVVVLCLSYVTTDPNNFAVFNTVGGSVLDGSTGFLNYVDSPKAYMTWLQDVFIPNYFVENDVNGIRLPWRERLLLADRASLRVGPARLRQTRTLLVNCTGIIKKHIPVCVSPEVADTESFGLGLQPETVEETRYSSSAWSYQEEPGSLGYEGFVANYPSGGFVADLDINRDISAQIAAELFANSWIDRATRSVVLEFTVYNANVNLFARAALLAEFMISGGVKTSSNVEVFRLHSVGPNGIIIQIFEVLFAVMAFYNLVIFIYSLFKDRCRPELNFSFGLDICVLLNSFYLISVYTLRSLTATRVMADHRANPKAYVEFGHLAFQETLYRNGWGFMTAFVTLKLCALLKLNERLARLGYCLRDLTKPMINFVGQASIMFMAFTSLAYLWYVRQIFSFSTFTRSSTTILVFALGAIDMFHEIFEIEPVFSGIYFLMLMVFVNFLLVNVMVIVVMDAHASFENVKVITGRDQDLIMFLKKDINSFIRKQLRLNTKSSAASKGKS